MAEGLEMGFMGVQSNLLNCPSSYAAPRGICTAVRGIWRLPHNTLILHESEVPHAVKPVVVD